MGHLNGAVDLRPVCNVRSARERCAPLTLYECCDLFDLVLRSRNNANGGTPPRQCQRRRPANSSAGACHKCYLSCKFHIGSPVGSAARHRFCEGRPEGLLATRLPARQRGGLAAVLGTACRYSLG
jgi:hypothetical protein